MTTFLDRREFVGAAAGGALLIANGAAAQAQTEGFGKPHPPIVAEDDSRITVVHPTLAAPAGAIPGYAAMPKTITPSTPGVVVVNHIWGVDATIRDVVRRYATQGYIAIAPVLFARFDPPSGDGSSEIRTFVPIAQKMYAANTQLPDCKTARDWIRAQASRAKVGITGFCMGGGITLQAVVGTSDYAAASMFYGDVRPPEMERDQKTTATTFAYTSKITTPLMGSFGALDQGIKAEDVSAMFATLKAPHDVRIYDGAPHAFFDDTRMSYRAAAAADAWTRTLAWFGKYLAA